MINEATKAIANKDQVGDIMHTFNYPYTIPQALLAEKVCEQSLVRGLLIRTLKTEANEVMIKMDKYGIGKDVIKLLIHRQIAKMGFMKNIRVLPHRGVGNDVRSIWTNDLWILIRTIYNNPSGISKMYVM